MTTGRPDGHAPRLILYGVGILSLLGIVLSVIALTQDSPTETARSTADTAKHNEAVVAYCAKHHPQSAARLARCVLHTHYSDLQQRQP